MPSLTHRLLRLLEAVVALLAGIVLMILLVGACFA